uniref:Uncharacterized protein n=1 Tax=Cajanus cajan TaxID=3821 RepID=A0A151TJE4_CAJCA|nr:hypothetical protein KK1_013439 [Cajanus cajan]
MEANENGGTSRSSQIVAMMSVPPLKVTEPRQVRKVLVSEDHVSAIQGCYQIVMYYEMMREEEHGRCLAGWIVESLAMVLLDHPLLAGRLHTRDHSSFEIVSNDSGVRLLEACYPTTLSHFLELNKKEHDLEADLVFWNEIDAQYPQFSPLSYVTNFECGGYSIGISCSLLLADAFLFENFLAKWAEIHTKMSHQREKIETPIFYHARLKNPKSLPSDIIPRTQRQNGVESMVFKISEVNLDKELWRELAMVCVEEAKQKQGTNLGWEFCLVVKESSEVMKVESLRMNGHDGLRVKHGFKL